ncbi:hypothetical protein OG747_29135 [Streptomyces sp. NBC_01384]|uniref:hypothetical protein n=1 Tax=Streptomyces sp. NBC_01384 TaxID=2903847 RepID=UPI003250902A
MANRLRTDLLLDLRRRSVPGVSLRDSRTVEVAGPVPQLYRLFGVFMRVAASLTDQQPYC